jgi:AcrR family transcriptional regulator
MRDSSAKRDQILNAAGKLFVARGFEATTLAMVAKGSGAAIGSITHFFGDKVELAGAVHEYVVGRLTADAETALNGHGVDTREVIQAVLSASLSWPRRFPHHLALAELLARHDVLKGRIQIAGLRHRLSKLLAGWAEPLIRAGLVAPLSPSQIYAVVLAPAISTCTASSLVSDEMENAIDWPQTLASMALTGIMPGNHKTNKVPKAPPSRIDKSGQSGFLPGFDTT